MSVIWLTGLSGVGKSTLSREIVALLREEGAPAVLLDGDEVRRAVGDPAIGHDEESRLRNAWRIARLARMMAAQDVVVVVATMSLFHEIHDWNRRELPGYVEVLLEVERAELARRHPRRLYERAASGAERHVVGVDIAPQLPRAPHLRLDNTARAGDLRPLAHAVLARARELGVAPRRLVAGA